MSWTRKIFEAARGRRRWKRLRRTNQAERYLFFTEEDKEITHWGVSFLKEYIEMNKYEHVIAFVKSEEIRKRLMCLSLPKLEIYAISEKEMKEYASYYALVNQSAKWTFVSVTCPYDTGAANMAGRKGFTKKDIVFYDIYKLA